MHLKIGWAIWTFLPALTSSTLSGWCTSHRSAVPAREVSGGGYALLASAAALALPAAATLARARMEPDAAASLNFEDARGCMVASLHLLSRILSRFGPVLPPDFPGCSFFGSSRNSAVKLRPELASSVFWSPIFRP